MARYVKHSRREPDNQSGARYWLDGLGAVAVWQLSAFVVAFLPRLSAKELDTLSLIGGDRQRALAQKERAVTRKGFQSRVRSISS